MECIEKRRLLKQLLNDNEAYRKALDRCRICHTCALAGTDRTVCQLDELRAKADASQEALLEHIRQHPSC